MKNNLKTIALLTISLLLLGVSSCKTKEVPGRRRTPRHCNTCTKWSYVPQEIQDTRGICLHDTATDEGESVSIQTKPSI